MNLPFILIRRSSFEDILDRIDSLEQALEKRTQIHLSVNPTIYQYSRQTIGIAVALHKLLNHLQLDLHYKPGTSADVELRPWGKPQNPHSEE